LRHSDDPIWQFLEDDRFIQWVSHPDEETVAYWEKWMEMHPEGVADLFRAREIATDLAYTQKLPENAPLPDEIWAGIRKQLSDDSSEPALPALPLLSLPLLSLPPRRSRWMGYGVAASVLGLLLAGAGFLLYRSGHGSSFALAPAPASEKIARHWIQNDLERINQSTEAQVLYLVDGSRVTLQPGSRIRHIGFLQADKREIYLEGNAFFDVAKDPTRPFYVYSKDLVVRVLGTSFSMTTNRANGDVTVVVRTGKVAISQKADSLHRQAPLILSSNQKAWYKAEVRDLVAAVPSPRELTPDPVAPSFISFRFEEAPVISIFKTLEEAYGIPFHYDQKTFSSCVITTSMSDETFEEKIKIVCEALGAAYRIGPDGVYIEGKPCK
jgi:transmembrane sensor